MIIVVVMKVDYSLWRFSGPRLGVREILQEESHKNLIR